LKLFFSKDSLDTPCKWCIYQLTSAVIPLHWFVSRWVTCRQSLVDKLRQIYNFYNAILGFHMTSQTWRGVNSKTKHSYQSDWVSRLFVLCISLVFGGKYMEFRIIFSLQYSISIDTFEVDPPSDSLHNAVVKPKNSNTRDENKPITLSQRTIRLRPMQRKNKYDNPKAMVIIY
jgi:hypothetical protein